MRHLYRPFRVLLLFVLCVAACLPGAAAVASPGTPPERAVADVPPPPANCQIGIRNGYQYWICLPTDPANWNKKVIVYAHGYVGPDAPAGVYPVDQLLLPGTGAYISDILTGPSFNYAFIAASYSVNGLAVQQGIAETMDLTNYFTSQYPATQRIYLAGVSEGGLITTLSAEMAGTPYAGAVAICGPIGDFNLQTNYFGDFRVVFDYFFPGLMPGTAISVPSQYVHEAVWQAYYSSRILPVITNPSNAYSVTQVLKVTKAPPYQWTNAAQISNTIGSLLWYNIFATNDAIAKLGGQPYDNSARAYSGSDRDADLNARVPRYHADLAALAAINAHYQTSGRPLMPVVTVHTTVDQVVPYQHEVIYRGKVIKQDVIERHDLIPVDAYGHCAVGYNDIVGALNLLEQRVANPPPHVPARHAYLPSVYKH